MSQTSSTSQLVGQLSEFMGDIQAEKTAAHEKDPGGHDGASTHPSADVDDSLTDASEGPRSSENSSDVKSDVETDGVDGHSEAKPGDGEDNQYNIGLSQSATGEEPSVEDDFKGDKDDPGTAHVADTSDGEKFGSLEEKYAAASFAEAKNRTLNLGNEILASFANGVDMSKHAAEETVTTGTTTYADPETKQAAEAGYALASALGMEKLSSEERVSASIEQTIKDAQLDADLVGGYLTDLATGLEDQEKTAEGMLPEELEDPTGGGAEGDIEGEPSGMEEGGDMGEELGGEMGGLPEELLGGGGGGGVEELLGGGEELGGEGLGEEDVAAALGGMEEPEAGIGEQEALQELAMALDELGIAPEELAAAAGEEGGLPKEVMAECKKLASAVHGFKRSGKFQLKSADTDRERHIRDLMKAHVMELVG